MSTKKKTTTKKKNKGGRPSKYSKKFCKSLIKFFKVKEKTINELKFFETWCADNNISQQTMLNWTEKHPEFFEAYKIAKANQQEVLIQNGLKGIYNPSVTIFTAKNILGWRDKVDHELTGKDGKPMEFRFNIVDPKGA